MDDNEDTDNQTTQSGIGRSDVDSYAGAMEFPFADERDHYNDMYGFEESFWTQDEADGILIIDAPSPRSSLLYVEVMNIYAATRLILFFQPLYGRLDWIQEEDNEFLRRDMIKYRVFKSYALKFGLLEEEIRNSSIDALSYAMYGFSFEDYYHDREHLMLNIKECLFHIVFGYHAHRKKMFLVCNEIIEKRFDLLSYSDVRAIMIARDTHHLCLDEYRAKYCGFQLVTRKRCSSYRPRTSRETVPTSYTTTFNEEIDLTYRQPQTTSGKRRNRREIRARKRKIHIEYGFSRDAIVPLGEVDVEDASEDTGMTEGMKRQYEQVKQMETELDMPVPDLVHLKCARKGELDAVSLDTDVQLEAFNKLVAGVPTQTIETVKSSEVIKELLVSASTAHTLIPEEHAEELDSWIDLVESIIILGYQVYRSRNITDVFFSVVSYIKSRVKKRSLTGQLWNLMQEFAGIFGDDVKPLSWEPGTEIPSLRTMSKAWDLMKHHPMQKQISFLISAAMSMTVCDLKSIEWSPFGIKLFSLEAMREQANAVDIIDAIIKTFVWTSETGYAVIQQRSLAPIIYGTRSRQQYHELVDYVLANKNLATTGDIDRSKYLSKVNEALELISEFKKLADKATAVYLQSQFVKVSEIQQHVLWQMKGQQERFLPFGISITGTSGIGKSSLSCLAIKHALVAMGYNLGKEIPSHIVQVNIDEAFDTGMKNDTWVVSADDAGNTNEQFVDRPAGCRFVSEVNTVPHPANMADLADKGKIFFNQKIHATTSNKKDLGASICSHIPESVLRRFVHVLPKVKQEFCKVGSSELDRTHPTLVAAGPNDIIDIWTISIQYPHLIPTMNDHRCRIEWRYLVHTDRVTGTKVFCKDLSLSAFLCVLVDLATTHKEEQERYLARGNYVMTCMHCDNCKMVPQMCRQLPGCKPPPIEENVTPKSDVILNMVGNVMYKSVKRYIENVLGPITTINSLLGFSPINTLATEVLVRELKEDIHEHFTPILVSLLPTAVWGTKIGQRVLMYFSAAAAYRRARWYALICFMFTFISIFCLMWHTRVQMRRLWWVYVVYLFCCLSWSYVIVTLAYYRRQQRVADTLALRRDTLSAQLTVWRDNVIPKVAILSATLIVGVKVFQAWNKYRIDQAIVLPRTGDDDFDEKPSWFGHFLHTWGLKARGGVPNATPSQAQHALSRNMHWMELETSDGRRNRCGILFLRKSVALIPAHAVHQDFDVRKPLHKCVTITVTRSLKGSGGVFSFKADESNIFRVPHLDLVGIYVPNSPDYRDISKWFPSTKPSGACMCDILHKNSSVELLSERVSVQFLPQVGHKQMVFSGGKYTTSFTHVGSCMSLLVSQTKVPLIAGIHIGGDSNISLGVSQTVTLGDVNDLINAMEQKFILSSNGGTIPLSQYNLPVLASKDIHPNAKMLKDLPSHAYIDLVGSTRLRSAQKSVVQTSMLSEHVLAEFGLPKAHGPPAMVPNWVPFNATLEHIINPSDMITPSLLERAKIDYIAPLVPLVTDELRPLEGKELVMGVPGKRFLEPMPMNTSMGFPVFGVKKKHFTDVVENGLLVDRIPSDDIKCEFDRLKECWKNNERGYPVVSAALKDEPVVLGSLKVRVFQACPVAMGMHIRKYFLPVARFLARHSSLTECAVGMNAFSPEWESMMQHVRKYNSNELLAFDYSKYDVRMNSQITRTVLQIMYELAAKSPMYKEEDLQIMRAMIADMVHPLLDYNGTMIQAYNLNTSGNNITVQINSIANSLYMRCGFFDLYPHLHDYRKYVAAMTYGDDAFASCRDDVKEFNFLTYRAFLARIGMKITPPDKNAVQESPYLPIGEVDFLKRQSQYIPEIECEVGRLDEDSILKSLHCAMVSKTATKEEVALSCMESALHEYFNYGREVYSDRLDKMRRVAAAVNIPPSSAFVDFDTRVMNWKDKYRSKPQLV